MNNVRKNQEKKNRSKRTTRVARSVTGVIAGTFLTRENVTNQLPFFIFIAFIAMIYISNSYGTEKLIIKIENVKKENEKLRYEHVLTKSRLMDYSRQSEVVKKLNTFGLKESVRPPYKLYVNEK